MILYIILIQCLISYGYDEASGTVRSIQGHVARAARGAVRSGPLRQADVLHKLQAQRFDFNLFQYFFNGKQLKSDERSCQDLSSENLPEEGAEHAHIGKRVKVPKPTAKRTLPLVRRSAVSFKLCSFPLTRWRISEPRGWR